MAQIQCAYDEHLGTIRDAPATAYVECYADKTMVDCGYVCDEHLQGWEENYNTLRIIRLSK